MPRFQTDGASLRWETVAVDEVAAQRLSEELPAPLVAARVLVGRGLSTSESAGRFLNPRLSDLTDPFKLSGLEAAATRLWKAIADRQKIVVFGDYDVDGLTGTAMLWKVLERLGGDVSAFVPNRLRDGYGFTSGAVRQCLEMHKPAVIVTTDCGTGAIDTIREAEAGGCDVLVTDHHEPERRDAQPATEVNPKYSSDPAVRHLAGVGVAFKLAHGLVKQGLARQEPAARAIDLRDWLDLVAIGTIGDIVPMLGENRILARHGLARIGNSEHVGIRALLGVTRLRNVRSYHVGFVLGPRLNAAGRLGGPEKSLELLTTTDRSRADLLAMELDRLNAERKLIEEKVLLAAREQADGRPAEEKGVAVVAAGDGWHTGILGIVAARISGEHACPAVIISFDDQGEGRGSCRAGRGADMMELLGDTRASLITFGGHRSAAGLSLEKARYPEFRERFLSACRARLAGVDMRPVLRVDAWLDRLGELDAKTVQFLDRMEPFGQENPAPLLGVRQVRVLGEPRVFGKKHLQMTVAGGGSQFDAVAFGMAGDDVPTGDVDMVFQPEIDAYHGYDRVRLQIRGWRRSLPA